MNELEVLFRLINLCASRRRNGGIFIFKRLADEPLCFEAPRKAPKVSFGRNLQKKDFSDRLYRQLLLFRGDKLVLSAKPFLSLTLRVLASIPCQQKARQVRAAFSGTIPRNSHGRGALSSRRY